MRKPEMGKYGLYRFFMKSNAIQPYLPQTQIFSVGTFADMLKKHKMVYVKPSAGSQGKGILKAWLEGSSVNVKKTTLQTRSHPSIAAAAAAIDRQRDGKRFIVQQGIHLAKVYGRPFDIRIMMQRDRPGGEWRYTAMCAKVAGPSSVVTNAALSKGTVIDVNDALHKAFSWSKLRIQAMEKQLILLGFLAANHFENYQPYRELGLDVAVDVNGRLWLLEENTGPSHLLFAKKHAKADFRRIQYRWGVFQRARRR